MSAMKHIYSLIQEQYLDGDDLDDIAYEAAERLNIDPEDAMALVLDLVEVLKEELI